MGAFWTYFRTQLAWPQIFRPGPLSALLEGLARSFDAAREDILWFRRQFSPVTCEDQYLDRHARSRRVKRFPTETDAQYRARVCAAYGWHLLGGKQAGMPQIVEAYGYNVGVASLRPEDEERFAEFRLVTTLDRPLEAQDPEILTGLANEYKRASSKLAAVRVERTVNDSGESAVFAAGVTVGGATMTIYPSFSFESGDGAEFLGGGLHLGVTTAILPYVAKPTIGPGAAYSGGGLHFGAITTIKSKELLNGSVHGA